MFRLYASHPLISALPLAVLSLVCPDIADAQSNYSRSNINVVNSKQGNTSDVDKLGMALEYFQTAKYHEALLIFQKLDKQYKLNPRFRAYIGLCYYYEWNYKQALEYFDKVLPELKGLSPHELSVYYYAAGESYFQLQQYAKALPYFQLDGEVCYNREKGDVFYRLGLCYMFLKEWSPAFECYSKAEEYYHRYRDATELKARLAQIANMKNGCLPGVAREIDRERSQLLRSSLQSTYPLSSPWEKIKIKSLPIIWK